MKKLLADPDKFYEPKERPSGHDIGKGFGNDKGGAIPPNLLQIPNTASNSHYQRSCKALGEKRHPARFPTGLPEFFIKFLTEPGDLVLDIFSGSNTTGYVAENLTRYWLGMEVDLAYAALSAIRFMEAWEIDRMAQAIEVIKQGYSLNIADMDKAPRQLRMMMDSPRPRYDNQHDRS
jgi:site-specific DNA-methyltransferase (cytosine-N4-specific)